MKEILDEQIVSSAFRSDDDNEDETTYNYDDEMFDDLAVDDEVVSVGQEFIEDGKEWKWIKQISSVIHIDFDNWAVWEAQSTEDEYVAYFVVDVDTGFIDWGPCDTEKEAIDFLNSKEDDEEEDSFSLRYYSDEEMDGLDEAVNDMDSLDAAAMTAHADRDINFFLELTDEKLAKLWALCNLEANNPQGRVYGEYVHEAISERRNSQEIFNKAKEIAAANGRAEKERRLETSLEDLKEDKHVMKKHLFRDDLLDAIDYLVEFKDIFPFPKEEFLASDWEDLRTGVYMGIDPEIEVAEGILQYLDKDLSISRKHPEIFEDDPQSELSFETYNALKNAFDKEIARLSDEEEILQSQKASNKLKENDDRQVLWCKGNTCIIKDSYGFGIDNGITVNRFIVDNDGKALYDYEPATYIKDTVSKLIKSGKLNNLNYNAENPKTVGDTLKYHISTADNNHDRIKSLNESDKLNLDSDGKRLKKLISQLVLDSDEELIDYVNKIVEEVIEERNNDTKNESFIVEPTAAKQAQDIVDYLGEFMQSAKFNDDKYFDEYDREAMGNTFDALNDFVLSSNAELDEDIDVDLEDDMDVEETNQKYTSAKTSINSSKLPAIFNMIELKPGTINLDFGGGKFDNVAEYLADKDVTNLVYDPYNRSSEHNKEIIERVKANGGADSATISNVLNVIAEEAARNIVLNNVYRLTKPDATVYITVYEGDSSGNSAETKSGYQLNRKTADYIEEIEKVFPNVERKGKLIIAKK